MEPSGTDEQTFARVFGSSPWAVMFILGRTGRSPARLLFHAGPGASLLLPVAVDWTDWARVVQDPAFCLSTLVTQWQAEFAGTIKPAIPFSLERPATPWYAAGPWDDVEAIYFEDHEHHEPFHEFDPWAWPSPAISNLQRPFPAATPIAGARAEP